MMKKSAVAVAIALGFTSTAFAAIDMSGSAKVGIDHNFDKEARATERTGELVLKFAFSQEINPDLTFSANAEAKSEKMLGGKYDDAGAVQNDRGDALTLGGTLTFAHTTYGTLDLGDTGKVMADAKVTDKIDGDWWKKNSVGFDGAATGYKYTNTFGGLTVKAGAFDSRHEAGSSTGFNLFAGYTIMDGVDVKASFGDIDGDQRYILGAKAADVVPGLTLAANYFDNTDVDNSDSFAFDAIYKVNDSVEVFGAALVGNATADTYKLGGSYNYDLAEGFAATAEANYKIVNDGNNVAFAKNTVKFWDGAEAYVSLEKADSSDIVPKIGASYSVSF